MVPSVEKVGLLYKERFGWFEDFDFFDRIALFYCVDYRLSAGDPAKYRVASIQPGGGSVSYEELTTVGSWAGVGHGKDACAGMAQAWMKLIGKLVAGATATGARRVAPLNHEVGYHAVG